MRNVIEKNKIINIKDQKVKKNRWKNGSENFFSTLFPNKDFLSQESLVLALCFKNTLRSEVFLDCKRKESLNFCIFWERHF